MKPELLTDAMEGLLLTQTPPLDGSTKVVWPAQRVVGPLKDTTGLVFTLMVEDALAVHQ